MVLFLVCAYCFGFFSHVLLYSAHTPFLLLLMELLCLESQILNLWLYQGNSLGNSFQCRGNTVVQQATEFGSGMIGATS